MFLEKIVVIITSFALIYILAKKYVLRYEPENIFILAVSDIAFGIYIYCAIYGVYIPLKFQIPILIFLVLVPLFFVYLQYNNIILSRKILYFTMKYKYSNKEYDQTIQDVNKLIELEGRKAEYCYILGMCYKYKKDFINSRDYFALAVEFDRRDYKSYYELGLCLYETNKKETAIVMINNALRIHPDFYEASEALGICLTSMARFDEAIIVYRNALIYNPNSYQIYYNIAMLCLELGNYEEAEKSFLEAVNIYPKLYSACYNLGKLNYLKGDYDSAIKYYKQAIESIVYGPKTYYKLAQVYAAKKDYKRSLACLEYAIILKPTYIEKAKDELVFANIIDKINEYQKLTNKIEEEKNSKKQKFKQKIKQNLYILDQKSN